MKKTFQSWDVDQRQLFPASVRDYVPDGHLAHFVRDLVAKELDLSALYAAYTELRGYPPYHPAMMTALLLYAYCQGVYSSRRIERGCEERVDFMAVTAGAKPDHSRINAFRRRHREALEGIFVQVLALCREAGLVRMGHVSLDGTKVKANASKHAAMSYGRMLEGERKLRGEVDRWLREADATDDREDDEHGKGRRGDELPDWVKDKQKKLEKLRQARKRLEEKAREEAERKAAARLERDKEKGNRRGRRTRPPEEAKPGPKEQSNFTDPESRIMKTGNGFEQAYNAQAAVDAESQVIVAQHVVSKQNDQEELVPALDAIEASTGELPAEVSADAGYCSETNLDVLEERGVRGYVATGRQKHGEASATTGDRRQGPRSRDMRRRLLQGGWRSRYRLRKQTVEPVFGQIKQARGFRQFLTRGLSMVGLEWSLLCTTHNLRKLAAAR